MTSASFDVNPFGAHADDDDDMEDDQEETRVEAPRRVPATPQRVAPDDEYEDKAEDVAEEDVVATPKEDDAEEEAPKKDEDEEDETKSYTGPDIKLSSVPKQADKHGAPQAKPKRGDTDETVVLDTEPKTPVKAKPAKAAKAPGAPRKAYVAKRHLRKDDATLEAVVQKSLRTAQVRRILEGAGLATFTEEAIKEARKVVFAIMADLVHGGVLVSKAGGRVIVKSSDIDMAIGFKLGDRARLYACEDMPKPRKRKSVNADGTPRLPPRRKPKAEAAEEGAEPAKKKRVKSAPKLAKTSAPSGTVKKRPRKSTVGASAAREPLEAVPEVADE